MGKNKKFYILIVIIALCLGIGCNKDKIQKDKAYILDGDSESNVEKYSFIQEYDSKIGKVLIFKDKKMKTGFGLLKYNKENFTAQKINEFLYFDSDKINFKDNPYLLDFQDGKGIIISERENTDIYIREVKLNQELIKNVYDSINKKESIKINRDELISHVYEELVFDNKEEKYIIENKSIDKDSIIYRLIER